MNIINKYEGNLKIMVASQGNIIPSGKHVIIEQVVDNFKNISVRVTSSTAQVFLPFYDTEISDLINV